MANPSAELTLALELADLADQMTLARFRAEDLQVETKPDLTPVSEADRAVEQAIRDRLHERWPEDAVVGEEYGADGGQDVRRRWIVDPIDGTKSYVRGVPVWATLLALEEDGVLTLAVVSAPALSRRWWAIRHAGAYLREGDTEPRRLRVSGISDLADAQLCFAGLEDWTESGRHEALLTLSRRCWRTRGYGDFWQYMLVAEGAAEVAVDPAASLWDLAAPMLIVEEAGGLFTDLSGIATPDGGSAIASNGRVQAEALAILAGPRA